MVRFDISLKLKISDSQCRLKYIQTTQAALHGIELKLLAFALISNILNDTKKVYSDDVTMTLELETIKYAVLDFFVL